MHIGYVYGSVLYPSHASKYTPQYIEGARLPHVWIAPWGQPVWEILPQPLDLSYVSELTAKEVATKRYSSLDLCSYSAFTIIIGTMSEKKFSDNISPRSTGNVSVPINIVVLGTDFEVIPSPTSQTWLHELRLLAGGGVIVRPDQHILCIFGLEATGLELSRLIQDHLDI